MKKIYLQLLQTRFFIICVSALFCSVSGFSQTTYTWNQTGTADWTLASNWGPTPRTAPAPNDILVFSNGAATTPINIPTQTIGQLLVAGNTTVNLQGGAAATTLTVSGLATGADLQVDAGSSLNINVAVNNTTITVATGATGSITGNMTFTNADHRLDAADVSGITFNSPSVFTQGAGCTGNVFTAAGTDNSIVFANGSTFNQLDGANPFAKVQPASKVVFNTGSLFHFQVPSSSPSFSGRTYANLQFSGSGTAATSIGASAVSIDNLTISTGTLNFNVTGTPGHSIKANVSVALGATLNFAPAAAGTVNLNGTAAQSITNNGTLTFGANQAVTVNNAAGLTINSPVNINNTLTLNSGNVILGANNLTANDIAGTFSTATHVVTNGTGKLILTNIGATTKIFPVGHDAATINEVAISNGTNINYGVRVVEGFPFPIFLPFYAVNRTWFVEAASTPAGMVNVDFYYSNGHGNGGFTYTTNVDFGIYTTAWNVPQVNIPTTGAYQVPTSVGAFQGGIELPMVIGNMGAILSAPRLVELSAQKINNTAQINWTNNTSAVFKEVIVERSANGRNFETLAAVSNTSLSYTDNQLLAGTNYYRIKLTDINGRISYSAIAAVINGNTGFDIVGLLPNIVTTTAQLNITAAKKTQVNVVVTDMTGRPVLKQLYNAVAGSNLFTINATTLPAGMYYVTATTATGEVKTTRFVKQ